MVVFGTGLGRGEDRHPAALKTFFLHHIQQSRVNLYTPGFVVTKGETYDVTISD